MGRRNYIPFKPSEIEYIKTHFEHMSNREIADVLGRTVDSIRAKTCELKKKMGITTESQNNPNPITNTTRMLICRYYKDNLRKGMTDAAAKDDIASALCREVDAISEVLAECMDNGEYALHNRYGTELRIGGVEW